MLTLTLFTLLEVSVNRDL